MLGLQLEIYKRLGWIRELAGKCQGDAWEVSVISPHHIVWESPIPMWDYKSNAGWLSAWIPVRAGFKVSLFSIWLGTLLWDVGLVRWLLAG